MEAKIPDKSHAASAPNKPQTNAATDSAAPETETWWKGKILPQIILLEPKLSQL